MEEINAYAPGKVILHGEHAVVYGKKAIAISVGLNTRVNIHLENYKNSFVKLRFDEIGIDISFTCQELDELRKTLQSSCEMKFEALDAQNPIPLDKKMIDILEHFVNTRALIHCKEELKAASKSAFEAFLFLFLVMFECSVGLEVNVTTDLPVGAGLGSSASFGVALAGGLLVAAKRMMKHSINKEKVNRWAYASECFIHGNPSGIDNSVATYGGAVLFQKEKPLQHLKCAGIKVLVVNTEVSRSTKDLVAKLAKFKETNLQRFEQVVNEIETIVENVLIELDASGQTQPEYVSRNQELLAELNVSHPKIDLIVDIAKRHKLSAKLTGAGGGGCVFIQLPKDYDENSLKQLQSSLVENGLKQFWCITLGGEGLAFK